MSRNVKLVLLALTAGALFGLFLDSLFLHLADLPGLARLVKPDSPLFLATASLVSGPRFALGCLAASVVSAVFLAQVYRRVDA